MVFSTKVNVIAGLEFEITYFKATAQHISYYTIETPFRNTTYDLFPCVFFLSLENQNFKIVLYLKYEEWPLKIISINLSTMIIDSQQSYGFQQVKIIIDARIYISNKTI